MIILLLGAPGSGKDTQASLLSERYGYKVISTGQAFRDEMALGTPLGERIKQNMHDGHPIDDEGVKQVLESAIRRVDSENIVLNGAIRRASQIPMVDEILKNVSKKLDCVLFLDLTEEEIVKRLSNRLVCDLDNTIVYNKLFNPPPIVNRCTQIGGKLIRREDDEPEVIKLRLKEQFYDVIDDILEVYREQGNLIEINASPDIETVHQDIVTSTKVSS